MTTTHEIVAAPKHAEMYATDCLICGHPELTKPIWLKSSTGQVFPAGTTCAANAVFGNDRPGARQRARRTADIMQGLADAAEQARQERIANYTAALIAFRAGADAHPALVNARRTYHAGSNSVTFPDFLTYVSTTGELI